MRFRKISLLCCKLYGEFWTLLSLSGARRRSYNRDSLMEERRVLNDEEDR